MKKKVRMSALKILKALLSQEPKSPMDLAIEIDREPQTVRNTLVHLKALDLIERLDYGKYTISQFGREYLNRISQPSTDQSSGESRK